jgi:hypothetical protein
MSDLGRTRVSAVGQERVQGAASQRQANWGRVRWYRAYTTYGKAPQVIEEVARFVRQEKLTDALVSLRVERAAGREFLLFTTFETDQWGVLPEEQEDLLSECRHLRSPIAQPYTLEDIQGLASGDLQIRALGQCLEYRRVIRESHEDPFETETRILTMDFEYPAGAAERLLWFLSANGSGSWSSLRAACRALGIEEAGPVSRLARHLRLLGHLETGGDGAWSVPPPAVVQAVGPDGLALRFLVGARDSRLDERDSREAQAGGPDRVTVDLPAERMVLEQAAEQILAALPDLGGYVESLEVLGSVNDRALTLRRFDGQRLERCTSTGEDGFYELTSADGRVIHGLRLGSTWRRGAFYTLRFLALWRMGLIGSWRYAAPRGEVAVRYEERPPELYERVLVLCSGLLPENRGGWLVYRNVPEAVALGLCERLEITLERG